MRINQSGELEAGNNAQIKQPNIEIKSFLGNLISAFGTGEANKQYHNRVL